MRTQWVRAWVMGVAMMGSTAAMADVYDWPPQVADAGPGKPRAEVLAELAEFQKNPAVNGWRYVGGEAQWVFVGTADSGKTRAEVLKELEAQQKDAAAQARYTSFYRGS